MQEEKESLRQPVEEDLLSKIHFLKSDAWSLQSSVTRFTNAEEEFVHQDDFKRLARVVESTLEILERLACDPVSHDQKCAR